MAAKERTERKEAEADLSLSLGERAGVRASVFHSTEFCWKQGHLASKKNLRFHESLLSKFPLCPCER